MRLTPSRLLLAQRWLWFGGGGEVGAAARGCCGSLLSHAVAAGTSRCSRWGARGWTAVLGLGASPAGEEGRALGCWWHPTAEPCGGWRPDSGCVCRARSSPHSAHRPGVVPVLSVGERRAGCLLSLPPSPLPGGETEARECFPRPGRVSMEMGAGVQAPSCRRGHPLNKGESGTLMGARPPGRASQPQPKIAPPGEHRTGSRPGANPAAGRGSPGGGSSQGVTPSPACRRLPRPVALGKGRAGGEDQEPDERRGESCSLWLADGHPEPPCPLRGDIRGGRAWGASL